MRAHDGGDSRPRIIAHGTRSPTASQPLDTYDLSSLRILSSSSSAKGKRERASCPRICASSSVVRPREREATETAEEREAS